MATERYVPAAPMLEQEDALAARDELIAVMGHELRNALSPLVLLSAQLELVPADDLMKRKFAMLARNLETCTSLLDRISEVSQLRAGKLELVLETVDAREIVEQLCADRARLAQASRCELKLDVASVVGRWDRQRLRTIVDHLLGNAFRYASGAPVEITLRESAGMLELVVHDGGFGIAPAERDKLFDRCVRRRRSGGLGVGLWVVKTLCEAMRGTIELVDAACGARFRVTLPRG